MNAYKAFDAFPIPVGIFNARGDMVFANIAMLKLFGIENPGLIVGKYNLLEDRAGNDLLGYRESIERAFSGEELKIPDFKPPVQDLVDRGILPKKPFESVRMEASFSPVKEKDRLTFVVCAFIVKSIYRGKPEIARAQEYLNQNWHKKFNPKTTAEALSMSVAQLYKIFKQHAGMTPGKYHLQCKIEHIKEKLSDKNLTIKEAFAACGEDGNGWISRVFKKVTGMTPKEFQNGSQPNPQAKKSCWNRPRQL